MSLTLNSYSLQWWEEKCQVLALWNWKGVAISCLAEHFHELAFIDHQLFSLFAWLQQIPHFCFLFFFFTCFLFLFLSLSFVLAFAHAFALCSSHKIHKASSSLFCFACKLFSLAFNLIGSLYDSEKVLLSIQVCHLRRN